MPGKPLNDPLRAGFSFLELQVALVIFGIALAGLGPLVVMQSRQLGKLESRFDHRTTHYLVPSSSAWARKLGASASICTEAPPAAAAPLTLIDDGDPGYSETDVGTIDWRSESGATAFHGALRWNNGGGVGDKASWEFTGLAPGWYEVLVTFAARLDRASNAPYTVYDGSTPRGTVRVNQKLPPWGPPLDGSPWKSLGNFLISGDTLRVELSDDADGNIVADAVRIVAAGNKVEIVSVEKSLTGEDVTAHVSVTIQVP
jgi:prepilin-type N-terminal cleavage/methylation domain-containing protein